MTNAQLICCESDKFLLFFTVVNCSFVSNVFALWNLNPKWWPQKGYFYSYSTGEAKGLQKYTMTQSASPDSYIHEMKRNIGSRDHRPIDYHREQSSQEKFTALYEVSVLSLYVLFFKYLYHSLHFVLYFVFFAAVSFKLKVCFLWKYKNPENPIISIYRLVFDGMLYKTVSNSHPQSRGISQWHFYALPICKMIIAIIIVTAIY